MWKTHLVIGILKIFHHVALNKTVFFCYTVAHMNLLFTEQRWQLVEKVSSVLTYLSLGVCRIQNQFKRVPNIWAKVQSKSRYRYKHTHTQTLFDVYQSLKDSNNEFSSIYRKIFWIYVWFCKFHAP